jgi:hypothetical protein
MPDKKSLITDKMIAEELRYQMRSHGLWTGEPRCDARYDIASDILLYDIACGGCSASLSIPTSERTISIDAFAKKHLVPVVKEFARMRGING